MLSPIRVVEFINIDFLDVEFALSLLKAIRRCDMTSDIFIYVTVQMMVPTRIPILASQSMTSSGNQNCVEEANVANTHIMNMVTIVLYWFVLVR